SPPRKTRCGVAESSTLPRPTNTPSRSEPSTTSWQLTTGWRARFLRSATASPSFASASPATAEYLPRLFAGGDGGDPAGCSALGFGRCGHAAGAGGGAKCRCSYARFVTVLVGTVAGVT